MKTLSVIINTKHASICCLLFFIFHFSFFIPSYGQIAINNTSTKPDVSAILDLNTGNIGVNKGFLAPQVALTNVNAAAPVTTPATGLFVYSTTSPTGGNGVGYYYWNGTAWAGLGGNGSQLSGSGANNYVARWTPNGNTLGAGIIQDNGTTVSIDTVLTNGVMLWVNSNIGSGITGFSKNFIGVTGRGDNFYGVEGYSANTVGVYGQGDNNIGVYGSSENATGVYGVGATAGGYFTASAGQGVYSIGTSYGGEFTATAGQGVYSISTNAAGDSSVGKTYGVYGFSAQGTGVYGTGDTGVQGYSANIGVYGDGYYYGVIGHGFYAGIEGISSSVGVSGDGYEGGTFNGNIFGVGGFGVNKGGYFTASAGQGVYCTSETAAGDSSVGETYGVAGYSYGTSGSNAGVYGEDDNASSSGVWGNSTSGTGVYGTGAAWGVFGSGKIGGQFSGSQYGLIVSSGNVGIGCTSPAYTLDVNGNIRATGSVLYGGNGCTANATAYSKPDYVFEPDYKKTYSPFEVEKFIIKEGHLPWVTSAADEKKENKGAIDITRMSFQTLEATENVQMQVIEQQKTIEELKQQNEELTKQVSALTNSVNQLLNKNK